MYTLIADLSGDQVCNDLQWLLYHEGVAEFVQAVPQVTTLSPPSPHETYGP